MQVLPVRGAFSVPGVTGVDATIATRLIPPWPGPAGNPPFIYALNSDGTPNWWGPSSAFTHVTRLDYTNGDTAHILAIMRPLNFTTLSAAAAAAATVLNMVANPATFSANYKYPKNQAPASTADLTLGSTHYIAVQLVDGTWFTSKVTSLSTLALTVATALPNVTGGGAAKGAPLFFFGTFSSTDPITGLVQPQFTAPVSASSIYTDPIGIVHALHPGDPLLFYDPNTTHLGTLGLISGYYSQY